ncbi:hypothetical protein SAMN05216388_100727 [Halorientalis persicus]|uniref:Uncharacterized protein n=1 Tax=Halorientalis persicus TaxID=1367881 RepID=A0A1H8L5Z9_9EURY|nr:hypothetical protein [Halorientalis persicus]SEO00612.1 hypothetical protein SAMN05216388_100727 [Halorientalis persicus]
MGGPQSSESHSLRGAIDRPALIAIRDFYNEEEPLASAQLDDFLNPSVLEVELDDGLLDATAARIDVQWTTRDDYKYHYTDTRDVNVRWGRHPHDGDYIHVSGLEHFHPPPNASSDPTDVEASCIEQLPEILVTRAVRTLWRTAYHSQSLSALNAGQNPP